MKMKNCKAHGEMKVLGNIQSLRAIAAWAVVYYHYAHHFYDLKPVSTMLKIVSFYGNFGVDLFFVISGLIMYYSASQRQVSAGEFVRKRLVRIMPAYWFYSMLLFLLIISPIGLVRLDVPYTWKTLAESVVLVSDDSDTGGAKAPLLYVGWTLTFEMIFYCIFATGLMLPTRHRLFLVFCTVLFIPVLWPTNWPAARVLGDYRMFEFASGMAAGAIWLHFKEKMKYRNILVAALMIISTGILLFMVGPYYKIGRILAATFIVIASLFDQYLVHLKIAKWLQKLGDYSYSTYLVHPIVIMLLHKHLGNQFSRPQEWLIIFGITILVYFVSILSWRWVENGPPRHALELLMRFGQSIERKIRIKKGSFYF